MKTKLIIVLLFTSCFLLDAHAGSATWKWDPADNNWNNPANWVEGTVPNGPSDTATFNTSNAPNVTIQSSIELGQIVFDDDASTFTIALQPQKMLTLDGSGVINNSALTQNLVLQADASGDFGTEGVIMLENAATTGSNTVYTLNGGMHEFRGQGGTIYFDGSSSASDSTFILEGGTIDGAGGGLIFFYDTSTGAEATFMVEGGTVASARGGDVGFGGVGGKSTAGTATVIATGGTVAGASGGTISFFDVAPSEPTLIATGEANGGNPPYIYFDQNVPGNLARVQLFGNGLLDISNSFNTTVGSLEGDGMVDLGDFTLTVGGNNQSTAFSGLIEDVTSEGSQGTIKKVGTGTLRLSDANTFRRGIVTLEGTVVIENQTGSGSGPGSVTVQAGTLAGKGIIAGPTTIGTGGGPGAFLAPGAASKQPRTLTLQKAITFKGDATYTYKLNTKKAKADQVVANSVTIETGAQFDLNTVGSRKLTTGKVFTAINNTATTPISGTFANLPDDATVTVGRNAFQTDYQGGDGNDLTLTVVQ